MKIEHPVPFHYQEFQSQNRYGEAGIVNAHLDPALKSSDPVIPENPQFQRSTEQSPYDDEINIGRQHEDDQLPDYEREFCKASTHTTSHGPKVWQVKGLYLKLSALEATVAIKRGIVTFDDLEIYDASAEEPVDEEPAEKGPSDPITGALSAAFGAAGTIVQRAGDYPILISKVLEAKESDQARNEIAGFAKDPSTGVSGIVGAAVKAPMDITHNVARGFHNLPEMYGDETVRPLDKVTGVQSGLEAAGKGFAFGLWDGISGLVTQPYEGAKKGGFMGGLVGFGKGIGGAVLKPASGAVGLPGYAFKGIYEEIWRSQEPDKQNEKAKSREERMIQGFEEWDKASEELRNDIYLMITREIEDIETMNF